MCLWEVKRLRFAYFKLTGSHHAYSIRLSCRFIKYFANWYFTLYHSRTFRLYKKIYNVFVWLPLLKISWYIVVSHIHDNVDGNIKSYVEFVKGFFLFVILNRCKWPFRCIQINIIIDLFQYLISLVFLEMWFWNSVNIQYIIKFKTDSIVCVYLITNIRFFLNYSKHRRCFTMLTFATRLFY